MGRWSSLAAPTGPLGPLGVFVLAFAARLVPVLRESGLDGIGNYDDGVYFAAALGLAHGVLPYRDFLLLHPPGIVVALLPFALVSRLAEDATGLLVARLAWMAMGATSAVLVIRLLRPLGVGGALLGGLLYAVFWPAVYGEWTVLLEGIGTFCLLAALVAVRAGRPRSPGTVALLGAGALLGFAVTVKIWGVLPLVVLAGWLWARSGRRSAAVLLGGAAAMATVICLPFFVAAPVAMGQMVVGDQLGRRRFAWSGGQRLVDLTGLSPYASTPLLPVAVGAVLLVGLAACVLAWRTQAGRLYVVLLATFVGMLLATPAWFLHYAAAAAGPVALTFGAGAAQALDLLARRRPSWSTPVTLLAGIAVLAFGARTFVQTPGRPFDPEPMVSAVKAAPGCVTSDEPATLVQLDVLGRNLERGCPFVVDLGGRSYHRPAPEWADLPRARNRAWQAYALGYLRSGDLTLVSRFETGPGFSRSTTRVVERWPVVARSGRYELRAPRP